MQRIGSPARTSESERAPSETTLHPRTTNQSDVAEASVVDLGHRCNELLPSKTAAWWRQIRLDVAGLPIECNNRDSLHLVRGIALCGATPGSHKAADRPRHQVSG